MKDTKKSSRQKVRVGVLYGGRSTEHEVSMLSAKSVLAAIDTTRFEPVAIGIDKNGIWHLDPDLNFLNNLALLDVDSQDTNVVTLVPGVGDQQLVGVGGSKLQEGLDVVFPVLHGPLGEDGTVQGYLELVNIPYVGPGVLGSAIGMDKDVTKRLLRERGIAVANYEAVRSSSLSDRQINILVKRLGLPLFVKPANMGSSVGVRKVSTAEELLPAISEALLFDTKVLVEHAIVGAEIECAVLGNDDPQASIIGRVIPKDGFYSYASKYLDETGTILEIPAEIPHSVAEKAREVAIQTFETLACEGMARVDMFATKKGDIIVNEINTIPGFTKMSMHPKLWEASGLTNTNLITKLINLALERFERRQKLQTSYTTDRTS